VLLVAGVLFIRLQYDMSTIASQSAQLQSATYSIGAGYSGIIEQQDVQEGDPVRAGEELFDLRSPDLATALNDNEISQSDSLYSVTSSGDIKITAATNGTVQTINYPEGAFVPANSNIAVIDTENATYVSAIFKLSPPDYAKLSNGNKVSVLLPDNSRVTGTVYGISLATTGNQIYTTVKVRIDQSKINQDVFSVGTPVQAKLYLNTTTWYGDIYGFAHAHIRPVHIFGKTIFGKT